MNVIVPTPEGGTGSFAHLALVAEGVPHEERECEGDYGYSELIAEMWATGRGFVIVEHDMAPWGGAVADMWSCPADWCMFRYYKAGGVLTRGLGCTKFSDRIVGDYPHLPTKWEGAHWQVLDGAVGGAVAAALRSEDPDRHPLCIHAPPVAHVRGLGED